MSVVEIPNGWAPRRHQRRAWGALERGKKRAVLVWHRRAGKDSMSVNWTAASCFDRVGVYWHLAPTQRQVRKIVWNGIDAAGRRIIDQAFPPAIRRRKNDTEMLIELVNGSLWQCVGSDNFDSLVGANPVGVVFSEWSLSDPRAWQFIRPILVENGGWAIFIYTPRGRNHGARLLEMAREDPENWYSEVLSVDDTGVVDVSLIEQERRELIRETGDIEEANSIISQEWYCSFDASVRGSYYGALLAKADKEGRVGLFPWDADFPVHTWWDLGIGDSTAIWFVQLIGEEVRVIDYLEASGVGLDYYAAKLKARPYRYVYHYYPHDAAVSELGTGRRRIDVLSSLGIPGLVLPRLSVDDGIQAVRKLLPRVTFNTRGLPFPARLDDAGNEIEPAETQEDADMRIERGLSALRNYRKEWDEKLGMFRDRPLHDWSSHGSDAFRTGAVGLIENPPPRDLPRQPPAPFTEAWFDEERAERDHRFTGIG